MQKCVNAGFSVIGLAILDRTFKIGLLSYCPGFLVLDYTVLMIYTIWKFLSEPFKAIQSTCCIGTLYPVRLTKTRSIGLIDEQNSFPCWTVQSLAFYLVIMVPSKLKRFQNILFFSGELIYRDAYETKQQREVSDKSAIHLLTTALKVLAILFIGILCYAIFPVYAFFFKSQRPLFIPILLPFVDSSTTIGYFVNIVHQCAFGMMGGAAVVSIELINCLLKNNIYAAKASIIYSLGVVSGMVKQNSTDTSQIRMEWRNVMLRLRDYDRFIAELRDLHYWKFLVQPIMLTYSVAASLLCYYVVSHWSTMRIWIREWNVIDSIKQDNWTSGVGFAMVCYLQIFILCDVGNGVENAVCFSDAWFGLRCQICCHKSSFSRQNDDLEAAMYAVPWYRMPRDCAEMVHLMIGRFQNGGTIRMGPFAALNYETASMASYRVTDQDHVEGLMSEHYLFTAHTQNLHSYDDVDAYSFCVEAHNDLTVWAHPHRDFCFCFCRCHEMFECAAHTHFTSSDKYYLKYNWNIRIEWWYGLYVSFSICDEWRCRMCAFCVCVCTSNVNGYEFINRHVCCGAVGWRIYDVRVV